MSESEVVIFPSRAHREPGHPSIERTVERRIGGAQAVMSFRNRWALLSEREKEVAKLLVFHDLDEKEVANELGISPRTIKYHMQVILRMLACRNGRRLALCMGLHIRAIVPEFKEEE